MFQWLTYDGTHYGLIRLGIMGIVVGVYLHRIVQHREGVGDHVLEIVGTLIALNVVGGLLVVVAIVGSSWCIGITAGKGKVLCSLFRSIVREVFWIYVLLGAVASLWHGPIESLASHSPSFK